MPAHQQQPLELRALQWWETDCANRLSASWKSGMQVQFRLLAHVDSLAHAASRQQLWRHVGHLQQTVGVISTCSEGLERHRVYDHHNEETCMNLQAQKSKADNAEQTHRAHRLC